MPKLRLVTLFVEYANGKYPDSFSRIKSFVDKIHNVDKVYYVIDNMNEGDYLRRVSDDAFRLGGNNSDWEFSGWQRGLDVLKKENVGYDVVLFANDAFMAYGWSLLETHASTQLVEFAARHSAAIGQIDTKGVPLNAFGKDVSSWICTNCFVMPKVVIQSLGSLVSIDETGMEDIVPKEYWEQLLAEKTITASDLRGGSFEIVCDVKSGVSFRFAADKCFVPAGGKDTRELCLRIDGIACGETLLEERAIFSGFFDKEGQSRWVRRRARIELLEDAESPLRISGFVPMDVLQNQYAGELVLKVYQTAPLFLRNAPLGAGYRQMVVKWLSEEWHSKLEIGDHSWQRFRRKVKAMLNESLLTARIREKGFRVESFRQVHSKV